MHCQNRKINFGWGIFFILMIISGFAVTSCFNVSQQAGGKNTVVDRTGYPKIANCYGSGLGYIDWEEGSEYWTKLSLIIGVGDYDFHYDWERFPNGSVPAKLRDNIRQLRAARPDIKILIYTDVSEAVPEATIPTSFWTGVGGTKIPAWPGYFAVKTGSPEVMQYNYGPFKFEVRKVFGYKLLAVSDSQVTSVVDY